jgi:hypothetical protein
MRAAVSDWNFEPSRTPITIGLRVLIMLAVSKPRRTTTIVETIAICQARFVTTRP